MSVGCPHCHGSGWVCEEHPTEPAGHNRCGGPGVPCPCPIGQQLERGLDAMREAKARGDEALWTLTKAGSRARAVTRTIPGVDVELRFMWNDDTRETKVYRSVVELAAAASQKRDELIGRGWVDPASLGWGI